MPQYFDSYFGTETSTGVSQSNAVLKLTDGDLTVEFTVNPGLTLLQNGWAMNATMFKNNGTYGNSAVADGQILRHAVFDNVVDNFSFVMRFGSTNDLLRRLNILEELLYNRAPRYWLDRSYNQPVWLERSMDGESQTTYALVSAGTITKPQDFWDNCVILNQQVDPVLVQINRQPFWLGARPGQVQGAVTISAQQAWNFDKAWAEDSTVPAGQVFCFVEQDDGDIYGGGESEILEYDSTAETWSAVTTTPVTLAADVTSAIKLANGDFLFGESGRVIKLSGGTWSVETSEPTGQVWALLEASDGRVYAADNGRIVVRDETGTWAEDDDLPSGQVYSLLEQGGYLWAGEEGQILRSSTATSSDLEIRVNASSDDAVEISGTMRLTGDDLDFFEGATRWIGLRFTNITIPQGAQINSAVIRLTAEDNDGGNTGTMTFYCEDVDNATTFTTAANNISGRTRTTASAAWTNPPSFAKGETYDTVDLSQPLQEVVNRAGWSSGNAVAFLVEPTTPGRDRDAYAYDDAPDEAPELVVTYTQQLAGGARWGVNSTLPSGSVRTLAVCDGNIMAGEDGRILVSEDTGENWEVLTTLPTNEVRALTVCGTTVYAGDNGNILVSLDCGNNWSVDATLPTAYVYAILCADSGDRWAGDNGRILTLTGAEFTAGQEATTLNQVFIANHHKESNLTHVMIDDAGAYTNIYPATSFPFSMYPTVATTNDAMVFGADTSATDSGPFSNLVFDIETPASAATSYTITWEYWNGAWTALTVQDNTSQFALVGVHTVCWEPPSDWTTTTLAGVTAYWVRARISALTGAFTRPTQASRDIYSVGTAFVELDENQSQGVIESLGKLLVTNRSDKGGPGGANPQLYHNRVLVGAKAVTDHESFRAFLNFADEQNPPGISVDETVDTDSATSFVTDLSAAVGRAIFFDASASTLNSLIDRVSIKLNTTIARDYYGTYRAFIRGRQAGGSGGEISLQLKVVSGSGGISDLTKTQTTASTNDHELIEFEEPIRLPVSALFTNDELGDQTSITLQIASSSASADYYAYDLFLLPVGVMYVDSLDVTNSSGSAISTGSRLLIDSITMPKVPVRSLAELTATGLKKASYRVDSNGEFRLLNNRQHRLWFLGAQTTAAGATTWISKPEVVSSVRLWLVDRWLTGRGLV